MWTLNAPWFEFNPDDLIIVVWRVYWLLIHYQSDEEADQQELFDFREDPAGVRIDSASLEDVTESVRELLKDVPVFE